MAEGATGSWPLRKVGSETRPDVPDLGEDAATGGVDGGGDGLPGLGLLLIPDAGDAGVADAEGIDGDAFGG